MRAALALLPVVGAYVPSVSPKRAVAAAVSNFMAYSLSYGRPCSILVCGPARADLFDGLDALRPSYACQPSVRSARAGAERG